MSQEKISVKQELFDWIQALVGALVGVITVFALLASVFSVDGTSMVDTLHDKDMLVISNLFYTPERGDIIMFNKAGLDFLYDYKNDRQPPLVKRVIAIGGDTVDYEYLSERFIINGEIIEEPYIREAMRQGGRGVVFPFTVPEGEVFCMGDNRNNSRDSRDPLIGCIDTRYILGHVLFRIAPLTRFGFVS